MTDEDPDKGKKHDEHFIADHDMDKAIDAHAKAERKFKGDWLHDAVRLVLDCEKTPSPSMKFLKQGINYDTHCAKCGREIKAGEPAQYGRDDEVHCIDCYIEGYGDAALLAKFLKMRYYERLSKEAEKKSDELAKEIETFQLPGKGDETQKRAEELANKVDEYLRRKTESNPESVLTRAQEEKMLDDMCRAYMEVVRDHTDIKLVIDQQLKKKKKRKELEEIQTAS